ncbi:MAG: DUF5678 domain-containing protein [Planctomycetaceae bacterium]
MSEPELTIPPEIERQYEGRWIAWDTVDRQVVGEGSTVGEAMRQASNARRDDDHLIWYHHVLPADTVIVGGL